MQEREGNKSGRSEAHWQRLEGHVSGHDGRSHLSVVKLCTECWVAAEAQAGAGAARHHASRCKRAAAAAAASSSNIAGTDEQQTTGHGAAFDG